MARKIDKTKPRQLAFALLTANPTATRAEMLPRLMDDFDIGLPYAKTLYQHWRKQSKASGVLTPVFTIRDHKDGVTVDPYLFKKHVSDPEASMATTEARAIKQYVRELKVRTDKARKL